MEQSFLTVMPEWNFAVSSIVSLTQEVNVLLMSLQLAWSWWANKSWHIRCKACSCPVLHETKYICIQFQWKTLVIAHVSWFEKHPDRYKRQSGTTEIWCKDIFEPLGAASFLPVQRIQCKFVGTVQTWKRENVLFVLPLERKIYL